MEIWRDIEGYEGLYMISSYGRIKSLGRWVDRKSKGKRWEEEKILRQTKNKYGYLHISLSKNGKSECLRVNRLVYETFVSEIPNGIQVNHINEDKTDNRIENLELCDAKFNCNYGTRKERIGRKLSKTVFQYDLNGNLIKEWQSTMEIERQLGFYNSCISQCCRGKLKQAYGYIWKYKNG